MADHSDPAVREELTVRRERLVAAVARPGAPAELHSLLAEVDAALARHADGTYGLCGTCTEPIEEDLLRADPLACFCLDHLSAPERSALQRDLDLARKVQQGLLPKQDVRLLGWELHWRFEPAGLVSGDYCDLVLPRQDGDSILFVVGDVSGKGVAASLLSSHLNALFRSLAAEPGVSIHEMMARANRLFCESTLASHYATLVAGRAGADGTVVLSNAAHIAPFVIRGNEVARVEGAGLPLGMFCASPYPEVRLQLAPGETLVVCTDGVTEMRDARGEEFGDARVVAALQAPHPSAEGTARGCLDAVERFRGTTPRSDDLTLLALRRSDG